MITALGHRKVDILGFLGGMVAQALVLKHPELVRKVILTGDGTQWRQRDRQGRRCHLSMTCCAPPLTRKDPKEFLFFNRDDTGRRAAREFVERSTNARRTAR